MKLGKLVWRGIAYTLHRLHSPIAVPTALGLCLTDKCNIQCLYCMRQSFKPPKGELSLCDVKYLIRKMPYIGTVTIQGLCEPYLNPSAPEIIRWLKHEGFHISYTTNGTIPLTGERLECLRDVDDFVISMDTDNPETFRQLRVGADLKTVLANLERVVKWKRSLRLSKHDNPPMHINAVITTLNFGQMKGLVHMLEPYSDQITYVMVDPVSRPDYSMMNPLALEHDKAFESWINDVQTFAKKESKLPIVGLDYMLTASTNWRDCPIAPLNLWLEPNGDIYYCYGFDYVIGNAFRDNPLFVFNNAKSRAFRKKLSTSEPPLRQCHSCNFARSGWQLHGGYLATSRRLSVNKPMSFYEGLKHVLSVLTRKGGYTF